jgi:Gpi18-like mannosyltransferase
MLLLQVTNKRKLIYLLLSAFLLRLVFLYPQYSGDVKNHLVWGNAFLENSVGIYSRHFSGFNDINYPPVAIFLFALANLFLSTLNNLFEYLNQTISIFPSLLVPLFKSENMSMGFLKLPGIISDIGIGYLIYKFAKFFKRRRPFLLASLYLFNPAVIYLSSVWGQIEPVTNVFLLWSLYLVITPQNKNLKLISIPIFCLAALVKQTALWFIPFYFILWYKELNRQEIIKGLLLSFIFYIVSYLPSGLSPVPAVQSYLSTLSGSSSGVTDNAWNFWYYLLPSLPADSYKISFLSVRQISIALLLLILFMLIFKTLKKYSLKKLFYYLFFWSVAVFFFQTRVHERHLAPALIFGLLVFLESPSWWFFYLFLSTFHFLNMFLTLKIPFI